jgi:hypothetical protein
VVDEQDAAVNLRVALAEPAPAAGAGQVTSELLGRTRVAELGYDDPLTGGVLRIDTDYFGQPRNAAKPRPGPFESWRGLEQALRLWPKQR